MTEYISRAELMGQLTNGEEQKRIKAMTGQEAYDRFLELVNGAADVCPNCGAKMDKEEQNG